jgi:hypothetical protein
LEAIPSGAMAAGPTEILVSPGKDRLRSFAHNPIYRLGTYDDPILLRFRVEAMQSRWSKVSRNKLSGAGKGREARRAIRS